MRLREHPHCSNCHHFKEKHFHCKKAWKGKIHPEQAGHLVRKLEGNLSLFNITCEHYHPRKHVRE
ncbi:MAG: hypothetical protein ABIJ21_07130 [Nanoarchaeota archaeon]